MQLHSFIKPFCLVTFYMNVTVLLINTDVYFKKLKGNLPAHLDIAITEGEKEGEP